jgi:hypothetical protein
MPALQRTGPWGDPFKGLGKIAALGIKVSDTAPITAWR